MDVGSTTARYVDIGCGWLHARSRSGSWGKGVTVGYQTTVVIRVCDQMTIGGGVGVRWASKVR